MARWNFDFCLGTALVMTCFAVEAASSPPSPTAPGRLAQSQTQTATIDSGGHLLRARKGPTTARFFADLFERAGLSHQSSSTAVIQSLTTANPSSSSLSQEPSVLSGSVNLTSLLNLTAVDFNTRNGPSYIKTSSTSAVAHPTDSSVSTTSGAAGAQVYRVTTTENAPRHSNSTFQVSSSDTISTVVTSIVNPTNSAALADGFALGGALLLFSKNAAQLGPNIIKPPTKTASLKSLDGIISNLENAFKDRGGVDTGGSCVAKRKRFRLRNRDLVSDLLNAFRCAINSAYILKKDLSEESPDLAVIPDDLEGIETWAEELKTDESDNNDDDDDDNDDETTTTAKTRNPTSQTTHTSETSNLKSRSSASEITTTTASDSTSQPTIIISRTSSSVPRSHASGTTVVTASRLTSQRTTAISKRSSSVSQDSANQTATVSSGQSINATCYTGPEYLFPASATASAVAVNQSAAFQLAAFVLSSFFAMDPPEPFTTASPNSTWARIIPMTKSSSTMSSDLARSRQGLLVVPKSTTSPESNALPSSTINSKFISNAIATPVPGQNGIAQCVYEIVADQEDLPAGTENYCFCAGGPDVSAASAPLLTHPPISSNANSITDCAYTTQPAPGWTPSITATAMSILALQNPTTLSRTTSTAKINDITTITAAASMIPVLPSYGFNCTQLEGVQQAGKDPKQINTCTCNDESKPSPTLSDHTYVCPSQVAIILAYGK